MEKSEVIRLVQEALSGVDRRFRFEIVDAGVRQNDDWWYVPVIASGISGSEPPHEFVVNVYANLEDRLQEEHHLNVMFVLVAA